MQLLLHIDTKGVTKAILDAAYAFFPPYMFTDSGNGVLVTTIDAAHDLSDEQWAIVASLGATVDLVLPAGVSKPVPAASTPVPSSTPSGVTPPAAAPTSVVYTTTSPITGTIIGNAAPPTGTVTIPTLTVMSSGPSTPAAPTSPDAASADTASPLAQNTTITSSTL